MFIHIGGRVMASDRRIVGVFNTETLGMSSDDARHLIGAGEDDRTVVIDRNNERLFGIVSPFTVIKRGLDEEDFIWRRQNEQ
ncbi:MAG TPA: hypothetical protein PK875_08755 [Spirochaetota bacterium]|nr:hypothetical protein [Spirochaetota bacterium]